MREILFRGKLKTAINKYKPAGSWIYGDFYSLGGHICIHEETAFISFPVDPDTVGEYTGLKDKHGVKIFEGDIVEHYGEVFSVEFENGLFIVRGQSYRIDPYGNYHRIRDDLLCNDNDVYEIIGNIHDNPGLPEEGEDEGEGEEKHE